MAPSGSVILHGKINLLMDIVAPIDGHSLSPGQLLFLAMLHCSNPKKKEQKYYIQFLNLH